MISLSFQFVDPKLYVNSEWNATIIIKDIDIGYKATRNILCSNLRQMVIHGIEKNNNEVPDKNIINLS